MNPEQLLQQAESLGTTGSGRPRQSDLRRAVSTAYYALFHLLTQAGATRVTSSLSVRHLVARNFDHKDMKSASRMFAELRLPPALQPLVPSVPPDLIAVSQTFMDLQEARHRADYDTRSNMHFTRQDVADYVRRVREAFEGWERVKNEPSAELYLLSMLFHPLGR